MLEAWEMVTATCVSGNAALLATFQAELASWSLTVACHMCLEESGRSQGGDGERLSYAHSREEKEEEKKVREVCLLAV